LVLNNLPVFAVQQSAPGRWLVRVPDADPLTPVVRVIAAIDEFSEEKVCVRSWPFASAADHHSTRHGCDMQV
jgi:hypothetical protein